MLAGVDLRLQAREARLVVKQQVERPRETRRRRFVAGQKQGHELVAQLVVLHLRAILEGGAKQHREDVVALGEVGS